MSSFGLFDAWALAPPSPRPAKAGGAIDLLGQWGVHVLAVLHVAATVWHVAARRDGVLDRMLRRRTDTRRINHMDA